VNFVNCIRFSPDGSRFLSVGSDKNGFLFDGRTGEKLGTLSSENGHTGSIYAASWSPSGKQVIDHFNYHFDFNGLFKESIY